MLNGPFESYDPEKGIYCRGHFEDGVMNGEYIEYTEDISGKILILLRGGFKAGMRHGTWNKFEQNGIIKKTTVYVDGRIVEED